MPSRTISCGATVSIRLPSNVIVPVFGRNKPETVRSVVVLPAPFAPRSVTISPSSTSKLTPRKASMPPYATRMPSTCSSIAITSVRRRTKISLDDCWVPLYFGWSTRRDHATEVEYDDAVGD